MTHARMCVLMAVGALGAGCTSLPAVDADICGNKVLERGEDCDGFAPEGASCGAATTSNGCFFTCDLETAADACPDGYGCGADGRCRKPSGDFEEGQTFTFPAERVQVGDLDGDRVPDIVGVSANQLHIAYGDGNGGAAQVIDAPLAAINRRVSIGRLNDDDLDDLIIPTFGGIATFPGNAARLLRPDAYVSFSGIGTDVVWGNAPVLGAIVDNIYFAQPLANCNNEPGGAFSALFVQFISPGADVCGSFTTVFGQPFLDSINADPIVASRAIFDAFLFPFDAGDIVGLGTEEAAIAISGADRVFTVNMLDLDTPARVFTLPAGAQVASRLFIAQLNGSGAEDLALLVTDAAGDRRIATRMQNEGAFTLSTPISSTARLLDVGDVTNDGRADFILDSEVRVSAINGRPGEAIELEVFWGDARVVDVNNDGKGDLVATPVGAAGVEVYLQGDALRYSRYIVGNQRFVVGVPGLMEVGDYDGDLIDDVALVGIDSRGDETISVLFGSPGGGFDDPQIMGSFDNMVQLFASRDLGGFGDAALDLVVTTTSPAGASVAVMRGDTSRQMVAPRPLIEDFMDDDFIYLPLDAVLARNAAGDRAVLSPALSLEGDDTANCLGAPGPGCGSIFAVDVLADGVLDSSTETQVRLPPSIRLECMAFAAADINSTPGDELVALHINQLCDEKASELRYIDLSDGGSGLQTIPLPPGLESASQIAAADLDGDGRRELLLYADLFADNLSATEGVPVTIFWNNPDGTGFVRTELVPSDLSVVNSVSTGRVDSDNRLELIVTGAQLTPEGFFVPTLLLGAYEEATGLYAFRAFPSRADAIGAAVLDYNVDGIDDVVITNGFSATLLLGTAAIAGDELNTSDDSDDSDGGEGGQ